MIPGGVSVLKEAGVWERVDRYGFTVKRGNTYVWGRNPDPWSIAFSESDPGSYAYQVIRSEFDQLLLSYAQECGAEIRYGNNVRELLFDENNKCIGVAVSTTEGNSARIYAPWIVDASGQSCIIGRKLNLRIMDPIRNNVRYGHISRMQITSPNPSLDILFLLHS